MERRNYSSQEAEQFIKADEQLRKNGLDSWTAEGTQANADLIDQFFQANPTVPVTVANIYKAVEQRKSEFVWLSAAAAEWYQTAQQNPELGNQLAAHLAGRGDRPGQLVNDGDSLFENLTVLFKEINSRRESASAQTIAAAENRIANRPQKQLIRVPQPRRTEPQSRAAREDDSTSANWLGRDMVQNSDGSWRSKTAQEQARDQEAREAANATPTTRHEPDAWETLCNQLVNYGSRHSQKAAMRETYDLGVQNGKSWREIYTEMNRLKNQYEFSPAPMAPSIKARSIQ